MKRRYLRHKTIKNPLKRAKNRCDDELQNAYRREYPEEKCESCGESFNLMHHDIEKSNSLYGRWMQPTNLIFMCRACHNDIHFGNRVPVQKYTLKRGNKWLKGQIKMRQISIKVGIKKLREIENYYKNNKPPKYETLMHSL